MNGPEVPSALPSSPSQTERLRADSERLTNFQALLKLPSVSVHGHWQMRTLPIQPGPTMREGKVELPSEAMLNSIIVQERTRQEQVNIENQQPFDLSCANEEPVRISSFTTPSFGGQPPPLPPETPMMRITPRCPNTEYVQQGSVPRSVRPEGTETRSNSVHSREPTVSLLPRCDDFSSFAKWPKEGGRERNSAVSTLRGYRP